MTDSPSIVDKVVDWYGGYFGTWIVAIGRRSGLFQALSERGPLSAEELAETTGSDPRLVAAWCRGAYAFEFLEHRDGRFRVSPEASTVLLDPSDPSFMGGRGEFFSMLSADFEMYPDRMADGERYPWSDRPEAVREALQAATRPDAANAITNVLPQLDGVEERLRAGGRILDAGCLSGAGLVSFAGAFPEAQLVGIDPTEQFVERARKQLGDRADVRRADIRELQDEDGFDLIWSNIALSHTWGAGGDVIAAYQRALKPGGWLLVSDVPHPAQIEDLQSSTGRMFVGVTLYVALLGPGLLTLDELKGILEGGGFARVIVADQPARTRMMLGAQKGE